MTCQPRWDRDGTGPVFLRGSLCWAVPSPVIAVEAQSSRLELVARVPGAVSASSAWPQLCPCGAPVRPCVATDGSASPGAWRTRALSQTWFLQTRGERRAPSLHPLPIFRQLLRVGLGYSQVTVGDCDTYSWHPFGEGSWPQDGSLSSVGSPAGREALAVERSQL